MKKISILLIGLFGVQGLFAQQDTVKLEEAIITANQNLTEIQTQSLISITDSMIERSQPSLTQLLNFNSNIYFKESGAGMVSSPSFRGTTASQTVVLWNGININSQTTGQTDFNTINVRGFDQIEVKAGGGNVAEINSSVGGSIHLINEFNYNQGLNYQFFLRYGSFNTINSDFRSAYSNEKLSLNLGYTRYSSDNDYEYPNSYLIDKNINGEFYNNNFSVSSAYKINHRNTLKFYGNIFQAKRNLSVISPYATRQKYEDYNTRSLIEWDSRFRRFESNFKIAYLSENYRFYPNKDRNRHDKGKVNSLISKYDLTYRLNSKVNFRTVLEHTNNHGFSGAEMSEKTRNLGAISLSAHHKIFPKFYYELSLRQELSEHYGNPILYSLGGVWEISDFYRLKFNASKNFRIPTYNDLYWPGVGNTDLKPETSYQAEINQVFSYKNFHLTIGAYYNSVKDLIRWIPNSNPLGGIIWQPENVNDVKIYGLEAVLSANKKFGNHHLTLSSTYAYTVSEDQEYKKQLIYVPYHKATASLAYAWKGFSIYSQFLYNGKVYTTIENDEFNRQDEYFINNLGLEYSLGKKRNYSVGFEVLNLMDYEYEVVGNRPMAGRSFHVFFNIKF